MFRNRISFVSSLCLLLGSFSLIPAEPEENMHRGMGMHSPKMSGKMAEKIIQELKLNDDQAAKVKAMFADGVKQMEEMRKDHPPAEGMHGEFMKQMTAEKMDTAAMNRQFAERMAKMQERHAMMVKRFAELHEVLTPEQRGKFATFMEKRQQEMKARREMGRKGDKNDKDDKDGGDEK